MSMSQQSLPLPLALDVDVDVLGELLIYMDRSAPIRSDSQRQPGAVTSPSVADGAITITADPVPKTGVAASTSTDSCHHSEASLWPPRCKFGGVATAGELWLDHAMDCEMVILLSGLGVSMTEIEWRRCLQAGQELPSDAPKASEEGIWERAMIGVCDHRQLPWGCVAAVWLMQLLKERLLNYVQLSRIPGSDYYLDQPQTQGRLDYVHAEFVKTIRQKAVDIWQYMNWGDTIVNNTHRPEVLEMLCQLSGRTTTQVRDQLGNDRTRVQRKAAKDRQARLNRMSGCGMGTAQPASYAPIVMSSGVTKRRGRSAATRQHSAT